VYNLIVINLYEIALKTLILKELGSEIEEDLYTDLLNLSRDLYSRLDPSLRNKVTKRGISIIQNSYIGFDSEYKNIDEKYNKLLSVQMAYNTRTLVKIPKESSYVLSTMHPLRNEIYKETSLHAIPGLKIELLENSFNASIARIRGIRYKKHDSSISLLLKGLQRQGIPFIDRDDMFIFTLPLSAIQPIIYFAVEGKGLSFKEMVKMTNSQCEPILNETYQNLLSLLEKISSLATETETSLPFVEQGEENKGEILPSQVATSEDIRESTLKRMTRTFMTQFTEEKISVSRIRNSYFIAHLTNADLSMLSDFEELKEQLDIVNKSFVTLGKPLNIENTNVFIRDTMLLTPAMNKSLDAIGMLYGFEKKKLTKEEISNMDVLLATDKNRFTDYAVRDAIIPLIHGNYMEHFNFQLKELGIPITLSSLGIKYVKHN